MGPNVITKLLHSKVLVIGAGALGCAVIPYLAGAGVGFIYIVDYDTIELSNLHRQVLYKENDSRKYKAVQAAAHAKGINSNVVVEPVTEALSHLNAKKLVESVDAVVDCCDNIYTRYLISDSCTLARKPLIYGAAMGFEGQVTVYCMPQPSKGPCLRCIHPEIIPSEASRSCGENGVMGPVPGVIGTLQAVETLKVLGGFGEPLVGQLCTYEALTGRFYTVKLPRGRMGCAACGHAPSLLSLSDSHRWLLEHGLDLQLKKCTEVVLPGVDLPTISCTDFRSMSLEKEANEWLLLDVRTATQFTICRMPGAVNFPYSSLNKDDGVKKLCETYPKLCQKGKCGTSYSFPIYCVCRRGRDSRRAVKLLLDAGFSGAHDIAGGLQAWRNDVDPHFPDY